MMKKTVVGVYVCGCLFASLSVMADPGIVVFSRNYLEPCNSKTVPTEQERTENSVKLKIFATPGEYEPVSFSVHADRKLSGLSVEMASDLQMGSETIAASNVAIRQVLPMRDAMSQPVKELEFLLMEKPASDLAKDKTRRYWVTVRVPQDAAPGTYTSTISVKEGKAQVASIKVELEVLPFCLDELSDMTFFVYDPQHYAIRKGHRDWFMTSEFRHACLQNQKNHGMNLYGGYVNAFVPGEKKHVPVDNVLEADNGACFSMNRILADIKETGFLAPGGKFIWLWAENRASGFTGAEGLGLARAYVDAVTNAGYEMILYAYDEPSTPERQANVRKQVPLIRKNFPEIKIVTSLDKGAIEDVGDYYDIWICAAVHLTDEIIAKAEKDGKTLWTYECGLAPNDATTSRYLYGYLLWDSGVKGAAFWAYSTMHTDDWGDRFDWNKGWDGSYTAYHDLVWPNKKTMRPDDSVAYESIREGIDDLRYLRTLETLIQRLTNAGHAEKCAAAQAYLEGVKARIDFENYGRANDEAKEHGEKIDHQYTSLYYRGAPDPALKKDDYNLIRRKVAEFIVQLKKAEACDADAACVRKAM